jgi:hypothetical protein
MKNAAPPPSPARCDMDISFASAKPHNFSMRIHCVLVEMDVFPGRALSTRNANW